LKSFESCPETANVICSNYCHYLIDRELSVAHIQNWHMLFYNFKSLAKTAECQGWWHMTQVLHTKMVQKSGTRNLHCAHQTLEKKPDTRNRTSPISESVLCWAKRRKFAY